MYANLLNRNSEFKFKCPDKHKQECFQPTNYKLFINILCGIGEGNILYKGESISNTCIWSTKEC